MQQIDVVVLTKNNAKTIAQCLNAIKKSIDVSRLIVIDDSEDNGETLRIVSKYTDQIHVYSGNIGEKRNHAIDLVVTPFFAFVDSDVIVNRAAYLKSMEILQSDESIAAVHNPVISIDPRLRGKKRQILAPKKNLTFGFALLRTEALQKSRIPQLPKGEDPATGVRLQRLGYGVAWQGEFACTEYKTLIDVYVHYFNYGKRGYFQGHPSRVIRRLIRRGRGMAFFVAQLFLLAGYAEYRVRNLGEPKSSENGGNRERKPGSPRTHTARRRRRQLLSGEEEVTPVLL